MKFRSVRYLIKEGFKNTWTNRLMTIASVGVLVACMVIIGLAVLISENANMAIGNLEKQNVIFVYMEDYNWELYSEEERNSNSAEKPDENGIRPSDYAIHNEDEAKALCDKIGNLDNVEKVEYISSEEGLKTAIKAIPEDQRGFFTFLEEETNGNPLPAAAKVTMKNMAQFDKTVQQIEEFDGVGKIWSNSDLAEVISAIKRGITIAGVWIIAILMIIALVIVSNTIRVTMYTRKLEIGIMKAVGATNAFIRLPFVVEGMTIGIVSAVIAEGLLYFCYRIATETIVKTFGSVIAFEEMALPLILIFLAIGIVSGVIGSVIIISKYLRKEGSEFSAI